jgi:hypothetical protein
MVPNILQHFNYAYAQQDRYRPKEQEHQCGQKLNRSKEKRKLEDNYATHNSDYSKTA